MNLYQVVIDTTPKTTTTSTTMATTTAASATGQSTTTPATTTTTTTTTSTTKSYNPPERPPYPIPMTLVMDLGWSYVGLNTSVVFCIVVLTICLSNKYKFKTILINACLLIFIMSTIGEKNMSDLEMTFT